MDQRLTALLSDLAGADSLTAAELHRASRRSSWLSEASPAELVELFTVIEHLPRPLAPVADRLLTTWLTTLAQSRRQSPELASPANLTAAVLRLYRQLGASSRARAQLLAWLAMGN